MRVRRERAFKRLSRERARAQCAWRRRVGARTFDDRPRSDAPLGRVHGMRTGLGAQLLVHTPEGLATAGGAGRLAAGGGGGGLRARVRRRARDPVSRGAALVMDSAVRGDVTSAPNTTPLCGTNDEILLKIHISHHSTDSIVASDPRQGLPEEGAAGGAAYPDLNQTNATHH